MAGTEGEGTPDQPVLGAHLACGEQFPTCLNKFMPFSYGRLVDIQLTHRLLMYLTTIAAIAMTAVAWRRRVPSRAFAVIPALLAAQILLGAMNVWLGKHPALIVAHLTLATILWATVVFAAGLLVEVPANARRRLKDSGSDRHPGGHRLTIMESATNTGDLVQTAAVDGAADQATLGRATALPRPSRRPVWEILGDYLALTKPRIISLLLVTAVATMFVADPAGPAVSTILWVILGGYLAAGSAGAINHYLERERDARMARTCARPLVAGRIEPIHGLIFGIALGVIATLQLAITVNPLAAALALAGLLGYVFVYTLWLKPAHALRTS